MPSFPPAPLPPVQSSQNRDPAGTPEHLFKSLSLLITTGQYTQVAAALQANNGEVVDPETGESLLMVAAGQPALSTDVLTFLVKQCGQQVNHCDKHSWSVLHVAAAAMNILGIDTLMALGADPTVKTRSGHTILHYLCSSDLSTADSSLRVLSLLGRILRRAPSILDTLNHKGETACHLAAQSGHIETLRTMVLFRADLSIRTTNDEDILYYAVVRASQPSLAVVRYLLSLPCQWNVQAIRSWIDSCRLPTSPSSLPIASPQPRATSPASYSSNSRRMSMKIPRHRSTSDGPLRLSTRVSSVMEEVEDYSFEDEESSDFDAPSSLAVLSPSPSTSPSTSRCPSPSFSSTQSSSTASLPSLPLPLSVPSATAAPASASALSSSLSQPATTPPAPSSSPSTAAGNTLLLNLQSPTTPPAKASSTTWQSCSPPSTPASPSNLLGSSSTPSLVLAESVAGASVTFLPPGLLLRDALPSGFAPNAPPPPIPLASSASPTAVVAFSACTSSASSSPSSPPHSAFTSPNHEFLQALSKELENYNPNSAIEHAQAASQQIEKPDADASFTCLLDEDTTFVPGSLYITKKELGFASDSSTHSFCVSLRLVNCADLCKTLLWDQLILSISDKIYRFCGLLNASAALVQLKASIRPSSSLSSSSLSSSPSSSVTKSKQSISSSPSKHTCTCRRKYSLPKSSHSGSPLESQFKSELAKFQRTFRPGLLFDNFAFPLPLAQVSAFLEVGVDSDEDIQAAWESSGILSRLEAAFEANDPALQELVAEHGVPAKYRARCWSLFTGAVKKRYASGWTSFLKRIEEATTPHIIHIDLPRTFPEHPLFRDTPDSGTPIGQQLLRLPLVAYSMRNPTLLYCQSMNFIGGLLLLALNGDAETTFWTLCALVESVAWGYFQGLRGLKADQQTFAIILPAVLPTVAAHFTSIRLNWSLFLASTLMPLLLTFCAQGGCYFPSATTIYIWDQVFLRGSEALLEVALVLLQATAPQLLRTTEDSQIQQLVRNQAASWYDRRSFATAMCEMRALIATKLPKAHQMRLNEWRRSRLYHLKLMPPSFGLQIPVETISPADMTAEFDRFATKTPIGNTVIDCASFVQLVGSLQRPGFFELAYPVERVRELFTHIAFGAHELIGFPQVLAGVILFLAQGTWFDKLLFVFEILIPISTEDLAAFVRILHAIIFRNKLYLNATYRNDDQVAEKTSAQRSCTFHEFQQTITSFPVICSALENLQPELP